MVTSFGGGGGQPFRKLGVPGKEKRPARKAGHTLRVTTPVHTHTKHKEGSQAMQTMDQSTTMASRIAKQRQERSAMRTPGRDAVMISTWPEALPLARGCRAVVGGLEKRSDLNGLAVDVESDETDGRYTVRCDGSGECVRVRSINLQVTAGWPSSWPSLAGQRLTEEAASSLCLAMVRNPRGHEWHPRSTGAIHISSRRTPSHLSTPP
jgi:hypothetical protein